MECERNKMENIIFITHAIEQPLIIKRLPMANVKMKYQRVMETLEEAATWPFSSDNEIRKVSMKARVVEVIENDAFGKI